MKSIRSITLVVALFAIATAAFLLGQNMNPPQAAIAPPEPKIIIQEKASEPMTEILVSSKPLLAGARVAQGDLQWVNWPEAHKPPTAVDRRDRPNALEEFVGVLVRANVIQGETVTPERFIMDRSRSFMSAILTEGMRAVAIPSSPVDTAGGFILPGDRVDILQVVSKPGATSGPRAEPLLTNVKILAIGSEIKEQEGQRVMVGATATIEVTPAQAELIAVAQKTGALTMTLRPFSKDEGQSPVEPPKTEVKKEEPRTVRIVRSGVGTDVPQ